MLPSALGARNGHGHGMSDTSQGPGWWLASDGKWYPPESWTGPPEAQGQASAPGSAAAVTPGQPAGGPPRYPGTTGPYGGAGVSPPYGYAQQMPYDAPAAKKTNGLAIASLVCSCAGILFFGVPGIVGIIFGFVARSQIRRSNGTQGGEGLALAGIIVGFVWIGILAVIIGVAASTANNSAIVPGFLAVCLNG